MSVASMVQEVFQQTRFAGGSSKPLSGSAASGTVTLGVLDTHAATTAQVLAMISESPENHQVTDALIGVAFPASTDYGLL